MTHSIAIHQRPDFDAIGAAWLLDRFLLPGAEVRFVRSGQTDETATAVVDTGSELDEQRLRFDHHQLPADRADISATQQVYEYLVLDQHKPITHLDELIRVIDHCDHGFQSPEANTSRRLGIHALLSARKAAGANDNELWQYGCSLLDDIAAGLLVRHNAQKELDASIAWADEDLGVVVLKPNAGQGVSFAAYDRGYDLVFYESELETGGFVRGMIRRSGCTRYHCGEMVALTLDMAEEGDYQPIINELSRWFQHPAGFFAGISEKGGAVDAPLEIPLVTLARMLVGNYMPDTLV